MAHLLVTLGTAALALVGDAAAKKFYLDNTYDSTNFFDKFDFFESRYGTDNYNDVDLTSGFINYRSHYDAKQLGLIKADGGEVYLGVEHNNITQFPGVGRSSVRLETKSLYNKSLIVARFTHLPKPVCGTWPAFWSYGAPWPTKGELDWFEGWNNQAVNKPAAHTYKSSEQGQCIIGQTDQSATVNTANCDQWAPGQYENQGCTATAITADPWGSNTGGVYAVEWTDDYIKFFAWTHDAAPKNIDTNFPDTSSWGVPSMLISNDQCNINNHFKDQRLVINIDFCGVVAGNEYIWKDMCAQSTGHAICSTYVAENPHAFDDVYFKIKDIRVFKKGTKPVSSSSSTSSATSSATSTSSSISASTSSVSSASLSSTSLSASKPDSVSQSAPASASKSAPVSHSATTSASSVETQTASVTDTSVDVAVSASASVKINASNLCPTSADDFTIYTTKISTITSCAPTVTDCLNRIGKLTTETIALYTTVCPVTAGPGPKPTGYFKGYDVNKNLNSRLDFSTITFTTVYTITKYPPSIPNCGIGSVTTRVITRIPSNPASVFVPAATNKAVPSGVSNFAPVGGDGDGGMTKTLPVIPGPSRKPLRPSGSDSGKPLSYNSASTLAATGSSMLTSAKIPGTAPGASATACTGHSCKTRPVIAVNSTVRAGVSFVLMLAATLSTLVVFVL